MICEEKKEQVVFYLNICLEDENGYEDTIEEANRLLTEINRR